MKNMSRRKPRKKLVETPKTETPIVEEPVTAPIVTVKKPTLSEVVALFPEAELVPTQRWYGETFYPKYTHALQQLKKLAT